MPAMNPYGPALFLSGGLFSPDPGLIFWTILSFLGLVFLLKKVAWGPIIDGLDRREESIRKSLEDTEKAREDALQYVEEQKQELSKAREETREILEQGKTQASAMKEEIMLRAREEAEQTIESARRQIDLEMSQARDSLREEVVDLTVQVAGKLLERSLDDSDHRKMSDEFLKEAGQGS
ncbi:MAG: F0F1 ATP synthase subunit B [Candidatus Krumholzibacteria bacterium]|jgi:F-type H+-transporting ATPase subunit b|nr:F0F1 ATP synthase subunit B [Candidatus Krumholzibacteria bacterium]MDP6669698.1 F0F1 ATP synthase subunit B [Candidatus Krumholzibacteria bacterium]MDP6796560.1 F0F1 ATP synthase subunit B [Candidatus Krumholzibacteria bacterium]MDP7021450.1 F0F1 ATP synthase subunit B [Candidatus Krumholzibacteria bacterium]